MTALLVYCLKLSVSLALVTLFYHFVLRKLTFYNWNRYYLLAYSLLSFFVAFIDVAPVLQEKQWSRIDVVQWVPALDSKEIVRLTTDPSAAFNASNVLGLVLISGMAVMSLRLLVQLLSFKRLVKRAQPISAEGLRFYQVNNSIIPFSFGKSIFINRHLHSEQELQEIIRHEFVHVKQKHSIDIIWVEVVCLLNWYNPFAWLLKASIRQNLEFIADDKVLENGICRKEYQYMLLKVIGNNQFSIGQKFNFSSLKKRIAMMNKLKSARLNLVRFLFILPLVAALLLAFRSKRAQTAIPLPAKSAPSPKAIAGPYDEQAIDTAPRKNTVTIHSTNETNLSSDSDYFEVAGDKAVIHLKNGTTEKYDLKDQEQRKKFEEKCGKVIIATTTPISPISAVTVDGVTKMVFPVKVSNNINATVATTATVATSITAPAIAAAPGNVSVVTTISPASIPGEPSVLTVDNNRTIVDGEADPLFTITKNTTREQLEELTRQMKEKGFDLNFKEIKYSEAGKLVSLTGTIKSKDATGSFRFAKSIAKLVVHLVSENNHTYLRIEEVVKHLN